MNALRSALVAIALASLLVAAGCGGGSGHDRTTSSVGTFDASTFDGDATLGQ